MKPELPTMATETAGAPSGVTTDGGAPAPETPSSTATTDTEADAPSVGREVASGLLGVGIAVACVLPPLVHLVTGPLGPFIAGFVAGNRAHPGARGRVIIAGLIGTGLAGIILIGSQIFLSVVSRSELPSWFPSSGTLMAIVGVIWVYGMAMSAAGTAVSSALARRHQHEHE